MTNLKENKVKVLLILCISIVAFVVINMCIWSGAIANDNLGDAQDNGKWTVYDNLVPEATLVDKLNPEQKIRGWEEWVGPTDPTEYKHGDNNVVKNIRIDLFNGWPQPKNLVRVHFDAETEFWGDVDYKFTIAACNHDGVLEGLFTAGGKAALDGEHYEDIWQSDCEWGNESIMAWPGEYDGYFYLTKVQVAS